MDVEDECLINVDNSSVIFMVHALKIAQFSKPVGTPRRSLICEANRVRSVWQGISKGLFPNLIQKQFLLSPTLKEETFLLKASEKEKK